MTIGPIQHVSIEVDDVDAAVVFYGRLGMVPQPRPDSLGAGAWLAPADSPESVALHLVLAPRSDSQGSQHVAFNSSDVDAAIETLRGAGIEVSDAFDVGAGRQCFLRDPAGNLVELNQPTGAAI